MKKLDPKHPLARKSPSQLRRRLLGKLIEQSHVKQWYRSTGEDATGAAFCRKNKICCQNVGTFVKTTGFLQCATKNKIRDLGLLENSGAVAEFGRTDRH